MAERRQVRRALVTGCVLGLLTAPVPIDSQEQPPQPAETAPVEPVPEIPPPAVEYEVQFRGPITDAMRALLEQVSQTRQLVDRPPASLARLRRRAAEDLTRLEQALRSRGYYAADVSFGIETDIEPVPVVFEVEPGPVYRLSEVEIELVSPAPELRLPSLEEIGLEIGQVAAAQAVLDAEEMLLRYVQDQGYPLARLGERRAIVDHDTQSMELTLRIDPGPRARFGPVEVTGLDDVSEAYVRRRLPWEEGELVTPERLAQARADLFATGLFTSARVLPGTAVTEEGELPVTIELAERPHRSIGLGVRFRTDEGPGGNLSFEHRNLFGAGERLELLFDGSGIGYLVEGDFRKPDFLTRDQALLVNSQLAAIDTDAFDSLSIGASVGLERILAPGATASLAAAFRVAEVEAVAEQDRESFGLLSLPGTFNLDRSDDLLNPTAGGRFSLQNQPFIDTFGSGVAFNRTRAGYTHYLQVLEEPELILAGRLAVGTLVGAARASVPADERFYAGGGGSVRGFGFQLAGQVDADGNPLGGRSLFEVGGEVRGRFTETLGGVVFVDAGSVFESTVPDFDQTPRIGAGLGFRYFSPIGPVRFDVAVPINRRDVDDAFQIYISFGQAF